MMTILVTVAMIAVYGGGNKMDITINFDMDGTIADLYGIENWLEYLINEDTTPYAEAKPLLYLSTLARQLNKLQKQGYKIAVISWLSKNGSPQYNKEVSEAKIKWLGEHLKSVKWDRITIVPYGTPKQNFCGSPLDILFDDEKHNRDEWTGKAYDVNEILEILKKL